MSAQLPPDAHTATLRIAADHPALAGHFPGQPVVPGVLILERVLQALQSAQGNAGRVVGLPQVKFLTPLLPDQEARIEWQCDATRLRFRVLRLDAQQQSVLLASGEFVLESQ
jgi:3-hydroxymyristoyl/3-hydroxydecanoyl-(acyl carrier protein) dehydratase